MAEAKKQRDPKKLAVAYEASMRKHATFKTWAAAILRVKDPKPFEEAFAIVQKKVADEQAAD